MKQVYLLIATILFDTAVYAQQFSWIKPLRPAASGFLSDPYDVAVDAQGNSYMVGTFSGQIDFDPGPGVYNVTSTGVKTNADDIFIVKLNAMGEFAWVKTMGSTGFDVAYAVYAASDGNVYFSGYFTGTVDFDPGPATYNIVGTADAKSFVAKFDTNGNFIWAKGFVSSSSGNEEGAHDITGDAAGNIYVSGAVGGTLDFDPGPGVVNQGGSFLLKLTANGEYKWVKTRGSGLGYVGWAVAYHNGHIYWGVESGIPSEVLKVDTSGTIKWIKTTQQVGSNTNGQPTIRGISVDASGNVVTTGFFNNSVDFDPGAGVTAFTANGTGFDMFVWKLDTDGNFKFARAIGSTAADYGYSVVTDDNGHVFVAGTYGANILMTIDGQTLNMPCLGYTNAFLAEFDASGQFLKASRYSSVNSNGGCSLRNIVMTKNRDIYAAGYYYGTVDFDPGPGTILQTSNIPSIADLFICKLAKGNLVTGKVFVDANLDNTYQATEQKAPFIVVRAANATDTSYGLSSRTGDYVISAGQGTYNISVPDPKVYSTATAPQTVNFGSAMGSIDSNRHIAVNYVSNITDVSVSVIPVSFARANRTYILDVVYENTGTTTVSGSVTLKHAPFLTYINSGAPVVYSGNTIQMNYSNLAPFETGRLRLAFIVDIVPRGTILRDTAFITPLVNDSVPFNNTYILTDSVRASLDPNDKQVFPSGNVNPAWVASDTAALEYTIRFQNTGNDTAFNVLVADTLSTNLDIASLEMIAASHLYTTEIEGRILRFRFNDIMLPDSTTNEALSHGYIRYKIKPLKTLAAGAQVRNRAAIYFDYNDPVLTNQAVTNIVQPVLPVTLSEFTVQQQACTRVILKWTTLSESGSSYFAIERNNNGDWQTLGTVKAQGYSSVPAHYSFTDITGLNGFTRFRLRQVDIDGNTSYSAVHTVTCDNDRMINVYPNPAGRTIMISTSKRIEVIMLYGADGRLVQQFNSLGSTKELDVSGFRAGTYMVTVHFKDGSKESQVFVKL